MQVNAFVTTAIGVASPGPNPATEGRVGDQCDALPGETSHCQHPKPPAVGQSRVFDHRLPSSDQFYSSFAGVRGSGHSLRRHERPLRTSALRITSVRSLGLIV